MQIVKKIALLLSLLSGVFAEDIIVYNNEYKILELQKGIKKLVVGNKEAINVSVLSSSTQQQTQLKIFGKKAGNTSILVMYKDGTIHNYHVYVNENLGFIQKMINIIEPNLKLSKVGDGSVVMRGTFENPHDKKRIYALLESADLNISRIMDLTETKTVDKMVRTKLYLVEINNQRAKDLGGVTGLGFFSKYVNANVNPTASNGATFSGWLLDNAGAFSANTGNSVASTLNFLESQGIGTILDDTVLMTTEDKNASFRVGGEVYIPIGVTQNAGFAPTIRVEERKYGLDLTLKSAFMEKAGFVHVDVTIEDSDFDTDDEHDVQLGNGVVVPSFISKNIQTNVVAQSGQVIVLGGRLHSEDISQEEKVPFLGDIPLLGELFTHRVSGIKNNDLLFFLVPEIVDGNSEIDETHYYKEFQDSSEIFHKKMLEPKPKENGLVVLSQAPQMQDDEKIIIEDEEPLELIEPELSTLEESTAEESYMPTKERKNLKKYAVLSPKIFLRDAPGKGKKATIWGKGHQFVAGEEETLKGITWIKIKEDCLERCKEPQEELWISKKYVEAL